MTSRDLRDAPAGTQIPGGWRSQGTQSSGSLSVLVQGWELAALSTRQQRCPWSHSPLPLPPQGQGTTEHPGFRIPPSPIPELISHLNPCSHHTKHELRPCGRTPHSHSSRGQGEGWAPVTPLQPLSHVPRKQLQIRSAKTANKASNKIRGQPIGISAPYGFAS